jgi:hypothetical protein
MDNFLKIPFIFHLNTNNKSFVLSDIKTIIDGIISILFFHSSNRVYIQHLIEIMNDLIRLSIIGNNNNYPTVKCDKDFINILNRFNELQKKQEEQFKNDIERIYTKPPDTEVSIV